MSIVEKLMLLVRDRGSTNGLKSLSFVIVIAPSLHGAEEIIAVKRPTPRAQPEDKASS